jgi:hypothetical protein
LIGWSFSAFLFVSDKINSLILLYFKQLVRNKTRQAAGFFPEDEINKFPYIINVRIRESDS